MVEMPFILIRLLLVDEQLSPERPSHDWKLGTFSPPLQTNSAERGEKLKIDLIINHADMMKPL